MAEEPEELVFDASLKKKKKKKKKEPMPEDGEEAAPAEDDGEEGAFDAKKKKKKKKKGVPAFDADDGEAAPAVDKLGNSTEAPDDAPAASGAGLFDKKKKKKKKTRETEEPEEEVADASSSAANDDGDDGAGSSSNATAEGSADAKPDAPAWADSDRDYTYEEMLSRVFSYLNRGATGPNGPFRMKPPQVFREGTKKVVLVNFPEICTSMKRPAEHVLAFMLAELGTSGSLDAAQRVTFKGRFQPKHIESIVRQYLKEYVLCKLCKSPDTKLTKDSNTRLYFMSCNVCSATRSVAPIKSGYQAQIGKRKKK